MRVEGGGLELSFPFGWLLLPAPRLLDAIPAQRRPHHGDSPCGRRFMSPDGIKSRPSRPLPDPSFFTAIRPPWLSSTANPIHSTVLAELKPRTVRQNLAQVGSRFDALSASKSRLGGGLGVQAAHLKSLCHAEASPYQPASQDILVRIAPAAARSPLHHPLTRCHRSPRGGKSGLQNSAPGFRRLSKDKSRLRPAPFFVLHRSTPLTVYVAAAVVALPKPAGPYQPVAVSLVQSPNYLPPSYLSFQSQREAKPTPLPSRRRSHTGILRHARELQRLPRVTPTYSSFTL